MSVKNVCVLAAAENRTIGAGCRLVHARAKWSSATATHRDEVSPASSPMFPGTQVAKSSCRSTSSGLQLLRWNLRGEIGTQAPPWSGYSAFPPCLGCCKRARVGCFAVQGCVDRDGRPAIALLLARCPRVQDLPDDKRTPCLSCSVVRTV